MTLARLTRTPGHILALLRGLQLRTYVSKVTLRLTVGQICNSATHALTFPCLCIASEVFRPPRGVAGATFAIAIKMPTSCFAKVDGYCGVGRVRPVT